MADLSTLNPQQRQAAETIHGPLMILAGAGTGKTRVITYRIAHMLDKGLLPTQIAAVTFTNKAAREMKERLTALCTNSLKGLRVGTFHSFCLQLLRTNAEAAGLHERFSLAGTSDQLDLIRRSLEENHWQGQYKPDEILNRISKAKNLLLTPDDICDSEKFTFDDDDPELLAKVYEVYERQLTLHRVIDFDDCMLKTVKMLEKNPIVKEQIHKQLSHLLVDEFQDTNFAQLKVLELLAGDKHNVCAVGDDDQSIYSWRGAMTETIDHFEELFPGTKLIKLEQNYRCSNIILNAANHVIRNNNNRKCKTLWSQDNDQTNIMVSSHQDDNAEARWIAAKCFGLLGQGYKGKDIVILYRANAQARSLEVNLREHGLHYKVFGGSSFFERKEVKDFLAYFKLSLDCHDRMSFWRVINTPPRGIGLKTLEKIEEKALENDISPFEALQSKELNLPLKTRAAADEFSNLLKKHSSWPIVSLDDLEKRANEIINSFGLKEDIKLKTSHEGARRRKLESISRLPKWIRQMGERQIEDKGQLNLIDLLDDLMLSDDKSQNEDLNHEKQISLMTVHASKGLEFPAVFVCGLEEELFPHKNSLTTPLGLDEERRLFYVAITRAKKCLNLSYARERYSNFQKQSKKPSRFLDELPQEGVVVDRDVKNHLRAHQSVEEKRDRNLARLSQLKNRLKSGF